MGEVLKESIHYRLELKHSTEDPGDRWVRDSAKTRDTEKLREDGKKMVEEIEKITDYRIIKSTEREEIIY